MNRRLALTSMFIAALLICDTCCGQIKLDVAQAGDKLGDFTVYFQPGKSGYINAKGRIVVEMKFDDFRNYSNGLAAVSRLLADPLKPKKQQRVYGFAVKDGGVAVPVSYSYADDFSEGLAAVNRAGRITRKLGWTDHAPGILSSVGDDGGWDSVLLHRGRFVTSTPPGHSGIIGGQWGYVNENGKLVIPTCFKSAHSFHEGLARVKGDSRDRGGQFEQASGYIDRTGEWVIVSKDKEFVGDFSEGLARFRDKRRKYGYIDKGGNVPIPARFYRSGDFRNGRAVFWIKDEKTGFSGNCGFIDKFGAVIVPAKYKDVGHYNEGLAPAQDDKSKWGHIGLDGRVVVPHQYEYALEFSSGLAAVKFEGRWGYIDNKGKTVIAPRYAAASHFKGQLARVNVGGVTMHEYRIRGTKGGAWRLKIKPRFNDARNFSEHLVAVLFPPANDRKDAEWGYIDAGGKIIIRPAFQTARPFHDSLAAVGVEGQFGYVDRSGKMLTEPQFQEAGDFSCGVAVVCQRSLNGNGTALWGLIDSQGNWMAPAVFLKPPITENNTYRFEINKLTCTIDRRGQVRQGDKIAKTVADFTIPIFVNAANGSDSEARHYGMIGLSVIGGQKAIETLEAVLEGSNPYTSAAAAVALEQITQSDALDVLLLRMKDRNSKVAARATAAAAVMISNPRRAITFMNKISRLPQKYREQLIHRAVMAVNVGPRTPESWEAGVTECSFRDMKLSNVLQFIRDVTGMSIYVDWKGLAELSIEPATTIKVQLDNTALVRVWDEILADIQASQLDCIVTGGVTIISTKDRLRAITSRSPVGRKKPAENKAVEKILQLSVSKLDFEDMELSQVLQFCRDVFGAKIEVDWEALAQSGVKPDTTVNLHLGRTTYDTALKLILLNAAGPGKLAYKIDDGKIHIMKAPKATDLPTPNPVAILTGALKHADRELRLCSAEALGETGQAAKTAIPALAEMLKDKDKEMRKAAAEAIEKINQTPATKPKPAG